MTADIRIRVDKAGRLHLWFRHANNLAVEVHDDRPGGGYRWATVAPNMETDISPTDISPREAR